MAQQRHGGVARGRFPGRARIRARRATRGRGRRHVRMPIVLSRHRARGRRLRTVRRHRPGWVEPQVGRALSLGERSPSWLGRRLLPPLSIAHDLELALDHVRELVKVIVEVAQLDDRTRREWRVDRRAWVTSAPEVGRWTPGGHRRQPTRRRRHAGAAEPRSLGEFSSFAEATSRGKSAGAAVHARARFLRAGFAPKPRARSQRTQRSVHPPPSWNPCSP